MLRPDGQLVMTDWCNGYWSIHLYKRYMHLSSSAHFKSYRAQECLGLLEETGFPQAHIDHYRINWTWGLMTARAHKPSV